MTATEKRAEAVRLMKSRTRKNTYTNGGLRELFFGRPEGGKGWSDCSSAVRKCIERATGGTVLIGSNTNAQMKNRLTLGIVVDESSTGYPNEANLKPGDCLYFKGNLWHTLRVGHVEMYTGPNECYGHGSGTGPNRHNIRDYCRDRIAPSKRYFMAVRWIFDVGERPLKRGCKGADVTAAQKLLVKLGFNLGSYGADGDYGKATEDAAKSFQTRAGLNANGVLDVSGIAKLAAIAATGWPVPPVAPADPMETVYRVTGIIPDVSQNQGAIADFNKFCNGTDFAIFRVWRSTNTIDTEARRNMRECNQRNYPFGVYMFFKAVTEDKAREMVRNFVAAASPYKPRFYVLDVESWYPMKAVRAAIDECRKLGVPLLGIYMGEYRWRTRYKVLADLFDFLWIANYGKNDGTVSKIPKEAHDLHQYTSVGRVPGISDKTCDLNRLSGTKPLSYFTGRKYQAVAK